MLGKSIRVRITRPVNYLDNAAGIKYRLNYGVAEVKSGPQRKLKVNAFIIGVKRPVKYFEGRVIARIRVFETNREYFVVAPKKTRFINHQIEDALDFFLSPGSYRLDCLYESSCGAVVFRPTARGTLYLLIKNKRSNNWGFPKGHIERGEKKTETAVREVKEETGLDIDILGDFSTTSEYKISGRIEKRVTIFLGQSVYGDVHPQEEEIDDFIWLDFASALRKLRFDNDKNILASANAYLRERGKYSSNERTVQWQNN